jgi:ribosomal protein S18 acetylase RimI-like enzyme
MSRVIIEYRIERPPNFLPDELRRSSSVLGELGKPIAYHKVTLFRLMILYRYFVSLESESETRTYYRSFRCDTLLWRFQTIFELMKRWLLHFVPVGRIDTITVFACFKENRVVGVCHIDFDRGTKAGNYGIVVSKQFRRRKIATTLSELGISMFAALGGRILRLRVDCDNLVAIKLYRMLGFRTSKKIERCDMRHREGRMVDCYEMVLDCSSAR